MKDKYVPKAVTTTVECSVCLLVVKRKRTGPGEAAVYASCGSKPCKQETNNRRRRDRRALLPPKVRAVKAPKPKAEPKPRVVKPKAPKLVTERPLAALVRQAKLVQPKPERVIKLPSSGHDPRLGLLDGGKWTLSGECPKCHKKKPTPTLCYECSKNTPRTVLRPDERKALAA